MLHLVEIIAAGLAVFGLGAAAGSRWSSAGRKLEQLLELEEEEAVAAVRLLPPVPAHEPRPNRPGVELLRTGPYAWTAVPRGQAAAGTPIYDQLAAEMGRRPAIPDMVAMTAAYEMLAGLDQWETSAMARIRGEG